MNILGVLTSPTLRRADAGLLGDGGVQLAGGGEGAGHVPHRDGQGRRAQDLHRRPLPHHRVQVQERGEFKQPKGPVV